MVPSYQSVSFRLFICVPFLFHIIYVLPLCLFQFCLEGVPVGRQVLFWVFRVHMACLCWSITAGQSVVSVRFQSVVAFSGVWFYQFYRFRLSSFRCLAPIFVFVLGIVWFLLSKPSRPFCFYTIVVARSFSGYLSLAICLSYVTYLVPFSCRASNSDPQVLRLQFFTP